MFTGIIEEIGMVQAITLRGNRICMRITAQHVLEELESGQSVAVNGVCLTVTEVHADAFSADVSQETLRMTNLGGLRPDAPVNLERALRLSDRLNGHLVQGHVDETANITELKKKGDMLLLSVSAPLRLRRYIVMKGSIALDGISLTVTACDETCFTCTILPSIVQQTNLRYRKVGDVVNLETDIIGRYVENLLTFPSRAVSVSDPYKRGEVT